MKKLPFLLLLIFLLAGCTQDLPEQITVTTDATATAPTGAPTEPPRLFPEAPVTESPQELPGELSADTLVQDHWTQQVQFPDGTVCYVAIPDIYPFSQEAIACQNEIYELFRQYLQEALDAAPATLVCDSALPQGDLTLQPASNQEKYFTYSAGYRDGVLSILLRTDGLSGNDTPYRVYNLAVQEEHLLPDPGVITIRCSLESFYRSIYSPGIVPAGAYHAGLETTMGENIYQCHPFYGADGQIAVLGNIYPPGMDKPEQQVFPLIQPEQGYLIRQEIFRTYSWIVGSFFVDQGTLFDHDLTRGVTETVHPGPVKLAIRSREHWFYTLEDTPGTVLRKDRCTKEETVLVTAPDAVVTDIAFFGYEDDGWLLVVYDHSEILLYQVPEFTCTTYSCKDVQIDTVEHYKADNRTVLFYDSARKRWEFSLDTGALTNITA